VTEGGKHARLRPMLKTLDIPVQTPRRRMLDKGNITEQCNWSSIECLTKFNQQKFHHMRNFEVRKLVIH